MESSVNQAAAGSRMKSRLIMSFYRAGGSAKSSSAVIQTAASPAKPRPVSVVKTVGFGGSDGYVHGPSGMGGDEHVDNRATCYISLVKERLRLEEANLLKGKN